MNRIRIRLKAYDYNLLDKSTRKIVKTAKETAADIEAELANKEN